MATLREMAEAFDERTRSKYGATDPNDFSAEAEERLAGWMADEVEFELQPERAPTSGAGWYTTKWDAAIDAISEIFPEIKEPNQRAIFTALMAITSDGQAVPRNFDLAIQHFGHYRENGRLPEAPLSGMGTGTAAFTRNLQTLQELIDAYGDGLRDHLTQEVEWRHIRASIVEAGGKDPGSAYEADARLPAAAGYFGPKLGAFLANLSGSQGYLTMDRWFMRTANRYRGHLASSATQRGKDRVKALLGRPRMRDATLMREIAPIVKAFAARGYKNGSDLEKAANTVWKGCHRAE